MIEPGEIYIVVDIETDGPVPGLYSMLSLGAVATSDIDEVDSFYAKLEPLQEASQDRSTMAWWETEPEAWHEVTTDTMPAEKVIKKFTKWLDELGKKPVFVAHPIAFDYAFVSWYLWRYVNKNPFANSNGASRTLDLISFIAGRFDRTLNKSRRTNFPTWMKQGMPEHSHNALDDARGYAVVIRNILARKKK